MPEHEVKDVVQKAFIEAPLWPTSFIICTMPPHHLPHSHVIFRRLPLQEVINSTSHRLLTVTSLIKPRLRMLKRLMVVLEVNHYFSYHFCT